MLHSNHPPGLGPRGCTTKKRHSTRVAASRPQALAMAAPHPKKAIAKLRLTLPPKSLILAVPQSCRTPVRAAAGFYP